MHKILNMTSSSDYALVILQSRKISKTCLFSLFRIALIASTRGFIFDDNAEEDLTFHNYTIQEDIEGKK
jgi:hypothetical protein